MRSLQRFRFRWRLAARCARVGCAWVFALAVQAASAQQHVSVPSLDLQHGAAVMLAAHWFALDDSRAHPAVLLLHGCNGAYDARGELTRLLRDYAALANQEGWHALAVDSLRVRGATDVCRQPAGKRSVTLAQRRKDALGALQWLAQQPGVDAERLVVLGWSQGGSTVLAATNHGVREVRQAPVQPRAAVAFYPGCQFELARGYTASVPLLMLLGESDDWTPVQPCHQLARRAGAPVQQVTYPGAGHGFDSHLPVRLLADVPNGVRPGEGVHVGSHPKARADSRERLLAFLREQLQ